MQSIITTPTVGETCEFSGYYAPAWVWRALGASRSYAYANNATGCIDFGGGYDSEQRAAYAASLLAQARGELGTAATAEQVIVRALGMYRADQAIRAQHALARATHDLAYSLRCGVNLGAPELSGAVNSLTNQLRTLAA